MIEAPPFFLPMVPAEKQEETYTELAKWAGRAPLNLEERIYSITYRHDGEEWTATVGQKLRGIRHRTTRSKGKKLERTQILSDPATVLAIFPGVPYTVVTDRGAGAGSAWENPFFAGQPSSTTYFSQYNPDAD